MNRRFHTYFILKDVVRIDVLHLISQKRKVFHENYIDKQELNHLKDKYGELVEDKNVILPSQILKYFDKLSPFINFLS